jgi:hypothetical protein
MKYHCFWESLKPWLITCCCLGVIQARAQFLRYSQAAPYTGLGAYSYRFVDVFSATANQAALARLTSLAAGVYAEKRFLQENLNSYTAAIALPTRLGGWGIAARYFGSREYNESQLGMAYGKKLGQVDIGVGFSYTMLGAAGYGSSGAITVEMGTIWHITSRVHTGIHVFNPAGGKYGREKQEKLPSIYTMGLGYEASDKLLVSADIIKEEHRSVNVQAGLRFVLENKFFIRAGIATASTTPWLGAGWTWKNIRADITGSYHPQLGLTPGLMLIFSTKKEIQE